MKPLDRFRRILKDEYYRRLDSNPNYSVRSFARSLGVNDSSLSKIMSGKRDPSLKYIRMLCLKLNISTQVTENIFFEGNTELKHLDFVDPDIHSDWRFDAILELTYIKNFNFSEKNIAKSLGITIGTTKQMLEKLVSSGRLAKNSNGVWEDKIGYYSTYTSAEVDEEYLKRYQVSLSQRSNRSILERPAKDKDHVSMVTCIDEDLMDEVRSILKKARRDILELAQSKSIKKSKVYAVTTNFFDLLEENTGEVKND
ncbi:MAG: DUF4423 domain-containing protein [Bdellovibrionales bacterium]